MNLFDMYGSENPKQPVEEVDRRGFLKGLGAAAVAGVAEGLGKDIKRLATGKDVKSRAGQEIAKSQDASMKGDTKTSKKHFDRYDKLDKLANKEQGVAEGSSESVSLRDMVNVVDQHYPKYYAELSGSDISDKQFERAIVNAYKKIMQKQGMAEEWSQKYKASINCSHPKGFSQKAHCAGKKKHNESVEMEMVCEDCGMCQTHGNLNEIKKGQKDSNGFTKCWPGKHAEGTKKGKNGGQVRACVPNESVTESRLYYSTIGTPDMQLRTEFKMRKDTNGWFLKENAESRVKLEAHRAFGTPMLKEYQAVALGGSTQELGPDNVVSPVGSLPRNQIKKVKKNG